MWGGRAGLFFGYGFGLMMKRLKGSGIGRGFFFSVSPLVLLLWIRWIRMLLACCLGYGARRLTCAFWSLRWWEGLRVILVGKKGERVERGGEFRVTVFSLELVRLESDRTVTGIRSQNRSY